MTYLIETERLYLRQLFLTDAHDMFEMDSNPKVHRFLGNKPVTSIEQSRSIIKNILQQHQDYGVGRLAMILKSTDEFIGWSGLKYEREVRKELNYYDLGYRLKEEFWGKGYATESAIASLKYGFTSLKLKEINACAQSDHMVSNKILKKIGMIQDGTFIFDENLCNWYKVFNQAL
jgi:ribosomal-protein-alanine N-acetyltransferase